MEYTSRVGWQRIITSIVVLRRPRTWFPDQTKAQVKGNWSGTMLIIYIFPETPTVFRSMVVVGVRFLSYRFHHDSQIQSNDSFMWGTKPLIAKVKWFSIGMNSPLPRFNHSHDVIHMCIVREKCSETPREINMAFAKWEMREIGSGGDRKKLPHSKYPFHSLLCEQIQAIRDFQTLFTVPAIALQSDWNGRRWKSELLLCVRCACNLGESK